MRTKTPTLRDLALDHIHAIAAQLLKADPTLSREKAVVNAAMTPEGREAHQLYSIPGSHLAWPQAVEHISKAAATKTSLARRKGREAALAATKSPASVIYAEISRRAVEAAPRISKPAAIAAFLRTTEGQEMWRQYNAALRVEDE